MDEDLSNDELLERARPTRAERAIATGGDPVIFLLTVVAWAVVLTRVPLDWCGRMGLCVLASLAIPLLLGPIPGLIANRRARRWIAELNRRCGRWPARAYRDAYRRRPKPDEVTCLFDGLALPGGSLYSARLVLDGASAPAPVVSATSDDGLSGQSIPWANVRFDVWYAPEAAIAEVRRAVDAIRAGGRPVPADPEVDIDDGFPCSVTIVPGDGGEPVLVSTNLGLVSDPPADDHERLTVAFATLLGIGYPLRTPGSGEGGSEGP